MSSRSWPARPSLTRTQAWTLGTAGTGSFMVALDLFAVSTALPEIHADLHASVGTLAWTVNAYTLSFAVLLVTAATLGDRWGRRRLYAGGLGLFVFSSVACALAPDIATLLAARVVQGAAAAVIMPLALALLNAAFPPHRRGWAMGIYGSITGLGTVAGPVLGGALTQALSWRWIFWINVPVGLLAAGAVLRFVADSKGRRLPIDPLALLLAIVSVLGIVWAIVRAATTGWSDRAVTGALAIGLVALGTLLMWQRRARRPMIPLRLFRNGAFSAGNAAIFAQNASFASAVFFTAQFFQNAQDDRPLSAGLRLLPVGAVPLLGAARSGAMADRFGPRPLVLTGLTLQAVGIAALASLSAPHRSYLVLVGPLVLAATGLTLALPALTKAVVGSVEPGDIGIASGLFTTLRQLGGAFGVAVTTSAFTAVGGYRDPASVASGYAGAMYVAAVLGALGVFAAFGQSRASLRSAPGRTGLGTSAPLTLSTESVATWSSQSPSSSK
ncbi:MAG TPA: MFS transporter [Streptosporangiaceae bacterium]|nr:MFS transporter [Streptosporangiaceae bacterium]